MTTLYWKVAPEPTGPYRSFQTRAWPIAYFDKERTKLAGFISCSVSYSKKVADSQDHPPLTLICDVRINGVRVRRFFRSQFDSLGKAKAALQKLFSDHPEYIPNN